MTSATSSRRTERRAALALRAVTFAAGFVIWAFSTTATTLPARAGLFLVAATAVAIGFGRQFGPALVTVGVMALAHHRGRLETLDGWVVIFVLSTAVGALFWLKRSAALKWLVASLPFWTVANTHPILMVTALLLSVACPLVMAVGPTLPGRRRRRPGAPLPHLANGPLVPISSAVYHGGQPSRVLSWLTVIFAGLSLALAVVAGASAEPGRATAGALALACCLIAATFAGSNWFATRVRLRIDATGLHSRTLFREHTIRWNELSGLTLRYLFLPGYGMRLVYYVAHSPTREFAFTSRMGGSKELQAAIESATGLEWPVPEVEGNFP